MWSKQDQYLSAGRLSRLFDMRFVTDLQVPQRMDPTDFGDPLTLHLAPSSG